MGWILIWLLNSLVSYVGFSLMFKDILGPYSKPMYTYVCVCVCVCVYIYKITYMCTNICYIKYLDRQSLGTKTNTRIQFKFKFSL